MPASDGRSVNQTFGGKGWAGGQSTGNRCHSPAGAPQWLEWLSLGLGARRSRFDSRTLSRNRAVTCWFRGWCVTAEPRQPEALHPGFLIAWLLEPSVRGFLFSSLQKGVSLVFPSDGDAFYQN